ncbi:hypothetical protein D9M72_654370 [compost metagenome]
MVSFAIAANSRSTAVMQRLGMHRDASRDFDHPRVPADQPALVPHVLYATSAAEWRKRNAK